MKWFDVARIGVWVGLLGIVAFGLICLCQPVRAACLEGDVDGNGRVDISDCVYLVQYVLAGGPAPVVCEPPDTIMQILNWCAIDSVELWFVLPGAGWERSYADSIRILHRYEDHEDTIDMVPEGNGGDTVRVRVEQNWPNEWNRWEVWWTNHRFGSVWVQLVEYGVEQRVAVEKRKR